MHVNKTGRMLLAALLITAFCSGCARPRPTGHLSIYNETPAAPAVTAAAPAAAPAEEDADAMTSFQELVVSLVSDSLDFLPVHMSESIYDVIQDGIEIPDLDDEIRADVLSSPKKEDITSAAAFIVRKIYSRQGVKGASMPQVIVYSYKDSVSAADLAGAAAKVELSENRNLDSYNACLNLLVNSLSASFAVQKKPRSGVYIRDTNNDLYYHSAVLATSPLPAGHGGNKAP